MNLAELLIEHPFADDEGLLFTIDDTVTAGQARAEAVACAARLRAAGVAPGEAVAVQLPNRPSMVIASFGVWEAGALYVPVNHRAPRSEVERILTTIGARALLTEDGLVVRDGATRYDEAIAFVTWTSGTTGTPKPIFHTHDAYVEILDRVLGPLRAAGATAGSGGAGAGTPKRPSPNLIPVSLALNAGLYNTLFALRAGAAVVIMDRFEPAVFAALVRRFEIRSTVLPPAAMAMLTDAADVTDLGPLKYVRSITAPLSPVQARRFADKFPVLVLNGYGQAEIGEVIGWTAADAKQHPDKIGAVGRPHPGVAIKLDGDGQLLVRPPRTAEGIEERTDADGFVATGDLARIDDDGFVWIEGRVGDVINRGGNKVHPDAVEEVLRLSPAVDDVAVVGVPDDRLGEVPVAFLVGRPVPDAELEALCRGHLVAYKVPAHFSWIDAIPRTEVGKVLRRDLAGRVGAPQSDHRSTT